MPTSIWPYLLVFGVLFFGMFIPGKTLSPLVFTTPRTTRRLFKLLQLKPGERFVDLGCGRGHLVIAAAKQHQSQAIGVENAPFTYLWATFNRLLSGQWNRVRIVMADILTYDLSKADVVYFYLTQNAVNLLAPKLERELRPGTRVVANSYPIEGWTPSQVDDPNDQNAPLYVYVIGQH